MQILSERDSVPVEDAVHELKLDRLAPASPTVAALIEQLSNGVPLTRSNVSRSTAMQIRYEVSSHAVKRLLEFSADMGTGPGVDFNELVADLPPPAMDPETAQQLSPEGVAAKSSDAWPFCGHTNPLIMAVQFDQRGVLDAVVDHIESLPEGKRARKFGRKMLAEALAVPSCYEGKTVLHLAAWMHGKQSKWWQSVVHAEQVRPIAFSGFLNFD